jgi:transcriptional regulator with XRE-family HTH domain
VATALGTFLRNRRRNRNALLKEVAAEAGLDVAHLSGLESGRRRYLGDRVAERLANALQLEEAERQQLSVLRQAAKGALAISHNALAEEIEVLALLARFAGGGISSDTLQAIRALATAPRT